MPARKPDSAGARARQLRVTGFEAGHMSRWITGPGLAADILIEAAITVGHNVEPRDFLIPQIDTKCIRVLFSEFVVGHGVNKRSCAQVLGVPTWPRQRTDDGGW